MKKIILSTVIITSMLVGGSAYACQGFGKLGARGGHGPYGTQKFIKTLIALDLTDAQKHDIAVILKQNREENKEKFKTMHNVFDHFTNRTIFKLISEGYFDGLESPISIGKEANIFSATSTQGRVMVKIYRLEA